MHCSVSHVPPNPAPHCTPHSLLCLTACIAPCPTSLQLLMCLLMFIKSMVPDAVLQHVTGSSCTAPIYFLKPVPCALSLTARLCTCVLGVVVFVPQDRVFLACCLQHFSGALACLPEDAQTWPDHLVGPLITPSLTLCEKQEDQGCWREGWDGQWEMLRLARQSSAMQHDLQAVLIL